MIVFKFGSLTREEIFFLVYVVAEEGVIVESCVMISRGDKISLKEA